MLDHRHPLTEHVFTASGIQDEIRVRLLKLRQASGSAEIIGLSEDMTLRLIPQLHRLNQDYFGDSAAIRRSLDALREAVDAAQWDTAWERFLDFAERPGKQGFGTWAI